tara:strand:+ start:1029 stop:1484 length:456 start_codon:yes stop_codon:yes gene_type:complete
MAILDYNKKTTGESKVFDKSSNISKVVTYSDLDLSFLIHPVLNDVTPLRDLDAVKQAVKNLVLTNFYERPFHPEIGGNVSAKLFEPADRFTASEIRDEIKEVLRKYEPRVNGVNVSVYDRSDANAYTVNIAFNIIFLQIQTDVTFNLQRLR